MFTFGMGPHMCLGMAIYLAESKALLALLTRGYQVEYAGDKPVSWNCSWSGQKVSGRMDDVELLIKPLAQPMA